MRWKGLIFGFLFLCYNRISEIRCAEWLFFNKHPGVMSTLDYSLIWGHEAIFLMHEWIPRTAENAHLFEEKWWHLFEEIRFIKSTLLFIRYLFLARTGTHFWKLHFWKKRNFWFSKISEFQRKCQGFIISRHTLNGKKSQNVSKSQ